MSMHLHHDCATLSIDTTCEDGTVHLVGGDDVSRGRVEYCYQGAWYSVCASDWDDSGLEAQVICGSLDYRFGRATCHSTVTKDRANIWAYALPH